MESCIRKFLIHWTVFANYSLSLLIRSFTLPTALVLLQGTRAMLVELDPLFLRGRTLVNWKNFFCVWSRLLCHTMVQGFEFSNNQYVARFPQLDFGHVLRYRYPKSINFVGQDILTNS